LKRLNAPSSWMLDKLSGTYVSLPVVGLRQFRFYTRHRLPDPRLAPTSSANVSLLPFSSATG
jgi:hypothetical protein